MKISAIKPLRLTVRWRISIFSGTVQKEHSMVEWQPMPSRNQSTIVTQVGRDLPMMNSFSCSTHFKHILNLKTSKRKGKIMFMLLHLKLSKQLWHYNHCDVIKSCSPQPFTLCGQSNVTIGDQIVHYCKDKDLITFINATYKYCKKVEQLCWNDMHCCPWG